MQSQKQERTGNMCRQKAEALRAGSVALMAALLLAGAGCGSTKPAVNSASQQNTYACTQNVLVSPAAAYNLPGGVWTLTLDDKNNFFSYLDVGSYSALTPPPPSIGNFTIANGFLDMTLNGGSHGSGGYAIEIPGSAAAFRPGDGTHYAVMAVSANSCQNPAANTTYQFVALGHPRSPVDASPYPAYGSIQATAQGTAWSFANFNEYTVDGASLSPAKIPSGTCAFTQEGYVVNIPTSDPQTNNFPFTVAVGPTGFFMADLGQNGLYDAGAFGLVGTVQPSSQLSTSDIVSGKYIGFQYVPLQAEFNFYGQTVNFGSVTAPVAFGQTAGSGTTITGGVYPDDDVTQTPPGNITIDLGTQDSKNNGLFKSVTVTIPDPTGSCIARPYGGNDANGNPTCVFPGVAVVGNPGGKFAVFVTADDQRAKTFAYAADPPIEFFLYQQ